MIPIVYFNTKILFLDDELHFFESLKLYLIDSQFNNENYAHFLNSADLLQYIQEQNHILDLAKLLQLDNQQFAYEYHIQAKDIYNLHKFATDRQKSQVISTIVVDYNLQGEDGLTVAAVLRKMGFSIILLTNHSDISTAVNAFNNGLIDFYIQKYAANLAHRLQEVLVKAQRLYFERQSNIYYQIIKNFNPNNLIFSIEFEDYFDILLKQHNISEFYLLDTIGSFMMVNNHCNILHVSQDIGNQLLLEIAEIENAPSELFSKIMDKQNMLCYFTQETYTLPELSDWHKYLQPATIKNFDNKTYKFKFCPIT